jgi:hypothetical protein
MTGISALMTDSLVYRPKACDYTEYMFVTEILSQESNDACTGDVKLYLDMPGLDLEPGSVTFLWHKKCVILIWMTGL